MGPELVGRGGGVPEVGEVVLDERMLDEVELRVAHGSRAEEGANMDRFMEAAIEEARMGAAEGGIPIGSVLVHGGEILGRGHNRRMQRGSVVLHGEMDALENAGRLPARIYRECVLYTTLSPCPMCSGAILLYGIPKVVVGENRTFLGEEAWLRGHGVEVEVRDVPECRSLMERFIAAHPKDWDEDIGE
jgi:cytosine deaminase